MTPAPQSTSAEGDRRRARGEESRRAIMEGAIDSLASLGLSGTTLDTVAARAGVSRSLVLFHFKSKNRLHIEVLEHLGGAFGAGWDAILAERDVAPADRLLRLLEYDVRFVIEHPRYVAVWQAVWGEARGSTLYREVSFPRDRRYSEDMRALLLSLAEDGAAIDIDAIVKGLEAMLFGFWWQAHIEPAPDHAPLAMRALRGHLAASFPGHFAAR